MASAILEAYDNFLVDVNTTLAHKSFVDEENRSLKVEIDQLMTEGKRKDEIITSKEEVITRLIEKISVLTKTHTTFINETRNEIRAEKELVQMKYEVIFLALS
jgi:hypothetical protein